MMYPTGTNNLIFLSLFPSLYTENTTGLSNVGTGSKDSNQTLSGFVSHRRHFIAEYSGKIITLKLSVKWVSNGKAHVRIK